MTVPSGAQPTTSDVKYTDIIPTAEEVRVAHTHADIDVSPVALHHSLGSAPNQAAAGNHTHDGGSSAGINYNDLVAQPGIPMIDYNNLKNLPVLNDYNNLINLPYIPPETPRVKLDSGSYAIPAVMAGSYYNATVYFNLAFTNPPVVTAIAEGSGRITCSIMAGTRSTGAVIIQANNNTGSQTASTGNSIYWTAVGY